jgi:Short C-terminal domain
VRLEQLRQLAALRDSGALTEAEFEAEKRRILES